MSWAVTGARIGAVSGGLAAIVLGMGIGNPIVISIGLFAAGFIWLRAGTIRRVDLADQFFVSHEALDLALPLTAIRLADERLSGLTAAARGEVALVTSADGELLGVLGPRQIRSALRSDPAGARCVGAMVAVRSLAMIPSHVPATALLADLAWRGFALVRGNGAVAVVEAGNVRRQLQTWRPLQPCRPRQPDDAAPPGSASDKPA